MDYTNAGGDNEVQSGQKQSGQKEYEYKPVVDDNSERDVIVRRTEGYTVIKISLQNEEMTAFLLDLEDLCNRYLKV